MILEVQNYILFFLAIFNIIIGAIEYFTGYDRYEYMMLLSIFMLLLSVIKFC